MNTDVHTNTSANTDNAVKNCSTRRKDPIRMLLGTREPKQNVRENPPELGLGKRPAECVVLEGSFRAQLHLYV